MKAPRLSLKQCLLLIAGVSFVAFCFSRYESWYGVTWTKADAALLAKDLAELDGEVSEELAVRIALNEVATPGASGLLPFTARRGTWTDYFSEGEPREIECYRVHIEFIPDGISGAFTRIPGGHCTVIVGLDGSVLHCIGGA